MPCLKPEHLQEIITLLTYISETGTYNQMRKFTEDTDDEKNGPTDFTFHLEKVPRTRDDGDFQVLVSIKMFTGVTIYYMYSHREVDVSSGVRVSASLMYLSDENGLVHGRPFFGICPHCNKPYSVQKDLYREGILMCQKCHSFTCTEDATKKQIA